MQRNGEELRTYREALEKRDEENSSSRTAEDRNRTAAVRTPCTHIYIPMCVCM